MKGSASEPGLIVQLQSRLHGVNQILSAIGALFLSTLVLIYYQNLAF